MSEMHDYNQPEASTPMVSNKVYDVLKPLASLYFPLLLAFYSTMSQIWKWPLEVQIVATLSAVQVLLGGLLVVSSKSYSNSEAKYDGDILVDDAGMIRGLNPNTGQVSGKDAVFKITSV